jgi:PAS domain S-box-containing protein
MRGILQFHRLQPRIFPRRLVKVPMHANVFFHTPGQDAGGHGGKSARGPAPSGRRRDHPVGQPRRIGLLGYARQEFVGKKAAEFYADPSEGLNVLARLARGETLRDYRTNLRARDGSLRNVLISSSADIENGRLLRARLLTQDITGHRRAEEEIHRLNLELEQRVQQRTAQLEAANKEMESFSYSVSHDLRAPLRALRGFTEVLLEVHASQLDSRGQDYLRRACAASFQMERLIEDLLKLAQVARADLQVEEVNLSSLAGDIAADLANSDSSRAVQFVIAPECSARGDPRLVRLALDNLLRNSWKFSGKRADARIEFGGTTARNPPSLCATTARDSTWPIPRDSSASSKGCTPRANFRARASAWPPSSASLPGTAAAPGPPGPSTKARLFILLYPTHKRRNQNPACIHHEKLEPPIANPPGRGFRKRRPIAATGDRTVRRPVRLPAGGNG